jgi:hypothetical protein
VGNDDLADVGDPGAQLKERRADHCGKPQIETAPEGKKANHRVTEAGKTNLGLERTVLPFRDGDELACNAQGKETIASP